MRLTIAPFGEEHLDAAAALLAARHRADREREPELPARFEEPAAARALIEAALRARGAGGVVARRGGRLTGYLVGAPLLAAPGGIAARYVLPRSVWVDQAGHATEPPGDGEVYRAMYAALAPRWLAAGCFAHYSRCRRPTVAASTPGSRSASARPRSGPCAIRAR